MTNGDEPGEQYLSSARSALDEPASGDAVETHDVPRSNARQRIVLTTTVAAIGGAVALATGGAGLGLVASSGRSGAALALFAIAIVSALAVAVVSYILSRWTTRQLLSPIEQIGQGIDAFLAGERAIRPDRYSAREPYELARRIVLLEHESAELLAVERRRNYFDSLTRTIARNVREHLDLEEVLNTSVRSIGAALQPFQVYIERERSEVGGGIAASWQITDEERPSNIPRDVSDFVNHVNLDLLPMGEWFVAPDLMAFDGSNAESFHHFSADTGVRSLVYGPILHQQKRLAAIVITDRRVRDWLHEELWLLGRASQEVGRALAHAEVFTAQQELVEKLQGLDRAKTEFISNVSHELRTPMTSITGYVEMLADGDGGTVSPEQKRMLEVVARNVARLSALIEDILTLSRVESGLFRLELASCDVGQLIVHIEETIRPQADSKELEIKLDLPSDLTPIVADGKQLERVLLNLMSNAVKFTPPHGTIRVGAEQHADELVVEVEDSGIGIPDSELDQLFSRFFRASNATERAIPGTGLGLSIAQNIVGLHGGSIDVSSVAGSGTKFTVRIPTGDEPERRGSEEQT